MGPSDSNGRKRRTRPAMISSAFNHSTHRMAASRLIRRRNLIAIRSYFFDGKMKITLSYTSLLLPFRPYSTTAKVGGYSSGGTNLSINGSSLGLLASMPVYYSSSLSTAHTRFIAHLIVWLRGDEPTARYRLADLTSSLHVISS